MRWTPATSAGSSHARWTAPGLGREEPGSAAIGRATAPLPRSGCFPIQASYGCAKRTNHFALSCCGVIRMVRWRSPPESLPSRRSSIRSSETHANRNNSPATTIRSPSRCRRPLTIAPRRLLPRIVAVRTIASVPDRDELAAGKSPIAMSAGPVPEKSASEVDGAFRPESSGEAATSSPSPTVARSKGGIQKTRPTTTSTVNAARFGQFVFLTAGALWDASPVPTRILPCVGTNAATRRAGTTLRAGLHVLCRQAFRRKLRQIPQVELRPYSGDAYLKSVSGRPLAPVVTLRTAQKKKARQGPLKAPSFPCRAVQSMIAKNIGQIGRPSTRIPKCRGPEDCSVRFTGRFAHRGWRPPHDPYRRTPRPISAGSTSLSRRKSLFSDDFRRGTARLWLESL